MEPLNIDAQSRLKNQISLVCIPRSNHLLEVHYPSIIQVNSHATFMNLLLKPKGMHISRGPPTPAYDKANELEFTRKRRSHDPS